MSRIEEAFTRVARREVVEAVSVKTSLERFAFEESDEPVHGPPPPIHVLPRRAEPAPVFQLPAPPIPAPEAAPDSDEDLVDFRRIGDYVGFVARSIVRHPYLAALTFILVIGATAAVVVVWPRTYHVEARLLAHPTDLVAAYSNPRPSGNPVASLTYAVSETILQHDNLVSLAKQTDLLNEWERTRPPAMRLKDRIMRALRGTPSEEDRLTSMVGLLEKRFQIYVTDAGLVVVGIDWPNGNMGYELVETALRDFVKSRQSGEVSELNESMAVLERYASTLERDVNTTFAEVQSELAKRTPATRRPAVLPVAPTTPEAIAAIPGLPSPPPEMLVRLGRMKSSLDTKRQEVARLEEAKAQQTADLQSKLAAALTVYTEGHPMVGNLRQSLATAESDSPQLQQARAEAQSLERDYVALAATPDEKPATDDSTAAGGKRTANGNGDTGAAKARSSVAVGVGASHPVSTDRTQDSTTPTAAASDYSTLTAVRLRLQIGQLADIRDRIAGVRLALATSNAGFKYRYELTKPPQLPRGPIKPNVPAVIAAGILGALVLAIAAALTRDLFGGRIVETWQVERQIGVPVLARVRQL